MTLHFPVVVCIFLPLCLAHAGREDIQILEDFDGNADPEVVAVSEGQLVDADGNGEKEGRFVTTNFAQVVQLKLDRGGGLIKSIRKYPVLAYDIAAIPGRNPGTFLQTQVHIGTNCMGGVYDIFPESQMSLPRSGAAVTVRLNLLEAITKGGIAFAEILAAYEAGDGSNLLLTITQQSSRDADTDCVYDDIRLEKAD